MGIERGKERERNKEAKAKTYERGMRDLCSHISWSEILMLKNGHWHWHKK